MSRYEVALSFAGEQRLYVNEVARALQSRGVYVFYDEFETVRLWGEHLAEELQSVYEGRASLAVMFISTDYVEKTWPRHERRAILSRAVEERGAYVLPVRFDDSEVPGLSKDLTYLRAGKPLARGTGGHDRRETRHQAFSGQGVRRTTPEDDLAFRRSGFQLREP